MIIALLLVAAVATPTYLRLRRISPADSAPNWWTKLVDDAAPAFMALSEAAHRLVEHIRQTGISAETAERAQQRFALIFTGETKVSYDGIDLSAFTVKINPTRGEPDG